MIVIPNMMGEYSLSHRLDHHNFMDNKIQLEGWEEHEGWEEQHKVKLRAASIILSATTCTLIKALMPVDKKFTEE